MTLRQRSLFPLVLLAACAFLTLRVSVWPGVPVLLTGDQGLFWT